MSLRHTRPRAGHRLRWLPNALTLLRAAGLPLIAVVALRAEGPTSALAGWLFLAVGLTDYLDGILARRLGAESAFGRVADPLVDRLLIAVGLVGLLVLGRLHPAAPLLMLLRDALAMIGFAWCARRGIGLRVGLPGKASSALAMGATTLAYLSDAVWIDVVFWIVVAVAFATLLHYVRVVRGLRA
jgi:CDP-diacylglycerol--glycerol-3-phosphate 3-phosphatidyltransferase